MKAFARIWRLRVSRYSSLSFEILAFLALPSWAASVFALGSRGLGSGNSVSWMFGHISG